jgi:Circularly permutated YpsA SLOG family
MVRIIVSGGQTGVDRAAHDFAMKRAILCTGWCPKGRLAEDGVIPEHYPLIETEEEGSEARTEANVSYSDGTLIIYDTSADDGTRYTMEMAYKHEKPFYMHDTSKDVMPDIIAHWLRKFNVTILNIAGSKESHSPGIHGTSMSILEQLFSFLDLPEEERMIPDQNLDTED